MVTPNTQHVNTFPCNTHLFSGRGRQGGADVRVAEAGRGRKGSSHGKTPGSDRDMGTVWGQQGGRRGQTDEGQQSQAGSINPFGHP